MARPALALSGLTLAAGALVAGTALALEGPAGNPQDAGTSALTIPGIAVDGLGGAASPPPPLAAKRVHVSEEEVVRGPADRPFLSLVINVGAGYPPAEEMLDVLASRGVLTTFFVMGWLAERNPVLISRIAEAGHEIASHGHSVFDPTAVSDAEVIADLERADAVISAITGRTTRPLWSASAGNRDARVRAIAAQLGYRTIFWSANSGDWRTDATAEDVRARILAGIEPGAIIELHMDSARSSTTTAAVLGEVIDEIRRRGLEPVTITELVGE
jgi:peptidoglycan/xylan/chitin deacetylase (PgdA/CDA1 family)